MNSRRSDETAGDPRWWWSREVIGRALREFAAAPLLVVAAFAVLAGVSIYGDRSHAGWLSTLRRAVGHFIGSKAATTTLQAIATGLVTVTSITFSVLLLAVQQTASNLSPVVFDQFIRRRINQFLLGFFIGLVLFSYATLAAVQNQTPPILGAAFALGLTILSLFFLLLLVYTTIDQMRPTTVLRQLHDRALLARKKEEPLLRRTLREAVSQKPVTARYRSELSGYVIAIDVDRLALALKSLPDAEIRMLVTLGSAVATGDLLAEVSDDHEATARQLADEVRAAIRISPKRDIDEDPTTSLDELTNIAWTSASTSKHNPEVARRAVDSIRDIAARWILERQQAHPSDLEPLRIVYPDNDLDDVFDALFSVLAASHESQQERTAAQVLKAYRSLIERTDGDVRQRLCDDVERGRKLLERIPTSRALQIAIDELRTVSVAGPGRSAEQQCPRCARRPVG